MDDAEKKMEIRQDTAVTWNWFRLNVPTIIAVAGVGFYINNGIRDTIVATDHLRSTIDKMQSIVEPVPNMGYRLQRAEENIKEVNTKVDNLSNTMINNIDLIRRDVNRLTTQLEVLSSQIGIFMGDEPPPAIQRRSRPGGPIKVE